MRVICPFLSCVVYAGFEGDEVNELDQAIAEGYSFIYVIAHDGIWLHQVLSPGEGGKARFVRLKVKEIPGVKPRPVTPWVSFLPAGKVPMAIHHEVRAFFLAVMRAKKTAVEAMIWVMWNQERGYFLHVPDQRVGGASASYDWTNLPPNSCIVIDIHSHADMNAFFSGTDNGDDRNSVRFSGVFGKNSQATPETVWRFNWQDVKQEVKVEDLFESPPVLVADTPSEWLDKVKTHAEGYKGYQGGGGYSGGTWKDGRYQPPYEYGGGTAKTSRHSFHQDTAAPQPGVLTTRGITAAEQKWEKEWAEYEKEKAEEAQKKGTGAADRARTASGNSGNNSGPASVEPGTLGSGVLRRTRANDESMVGRPGNVISINGQDFLKGPAGVLIPGQKGKTYLDNGQYLQEVLDVTPVGEQRELAFAGNTVGLPEIPDEDTAEALDLDHYIGASPEAQSEALERMQMRLRQESLVADDEIRNIVDSQKASRAETSFEAGLVTSPSGSWIFITPDDYTRDHDEIAIENGPQVAAAYSIITNLADVLTGTGDPLRKIVEELFSAVPEEEQLAVFRSLHGYLNTQATTSLAQNGF